MTDLAWQAWRLVTEVALQRDRKVAVSQAVGLSWSRVLVLRCLTAGPHTQRALAEHLTVDAPYVTLIADDLERRGLVTRSPDPDDRRAKRVALTPAGRRVVRRVERILHKPPPELNDAADADLAAVLRALEPLRRG